jgi:hypothetical protein
MLRFRNNTAATNKTQPAGRRAIVGRWKAAC